MNPKYPLFIILSLFLFVGCRENYKAEKLFWKATQQYKQDGVADFKQASIAEIAPIRAVFYEVAETYPDTPKGRESLTVIAQIYVAHQHFSQARKTLGKLIDITRIEKHVTRARFQIAQLYEAEGLWEAAEKAYWSLARDYALNPAGLKAPLKVLRHYRKLQGHEKEFEAASVRAHSLYAKLLKKLGTIEPSAKVQKYVAQAYALKGDWKRARDLLYETAIQFPEYTGAPSYLIRAGDISVDHKDYDKGADIYRAYINTYPRHTEYAKTLLKLASIERDQGLYEEAIERYEEILDRAGKDPETAAMLKLEIAKTYQVAFRWGKAEKTLIEASTQYPNTKAVQGIPLLYASHYYKSGYKDKGDRYLSQAIKGYRELELTAGDDRNVTFYQKLQNRALMQKGDWQGFLANIDSYLESEKTELKRGQWLFLKALIFEQRLQDPKSANQLYKTFLEEYPGHPLAAIAKTRQTTYLSPLA